MKINEIKKIVEGLKHPKTEKDLERFAKILSDNGINIDSLYEELEMSSKYVNMHKDVSFVKMPIRLHSHSFYEVIFCRTADDVDYLIGSKKYKITPGDIIVIAPGVIHAPILPEKMNVPYERDILWVNADFMKKTADLFPDAAPDMIDKIMLLRTRGTEWAYIGEYFNDGVNESINQRPGYDKIISAHAILIISHILRAVIAGGRNFKEEEPTLINSIIEYVEGHLDEKLTLDSVATKFYISRGTLNKLFKEYMDSTFYSFVIQRRLILAKVYIGAGESMEAVSFKCGFSDYSTFYKAFKKEFGISPREFAKL